jgi:hypothetical protein
VVGETAADEDRRGPFTATAASHGHPSGRNLAPSMLHQHHSHAEAVARITWLIGEYAIGVVTGEVGAGKTVAARAAVAALDPVRHSVIYLLPHGADVNNPARNSPGLQPRAQPLPRCRPPGGWPALAGAGGRQALKGDELASDQGGVRCSGPSGLP